MVIDNLYLVLILQEKAIKQNADLKMAIVEANETIYEMSIMYLKLKDKK